MTTDIQRRNEGGDYALSLMGAMEGELRRAFPQHVMAERFLRVCLTQLRTVDRLLACDRQSLMAALMQVAELGLEPGRHCYLVPYGREATLVIDYRGYIELARRSGQVRSISARVVHEGDFVEVMQGTEEYITHRPRFVDRGEPVAVYAVAILEDGATQFEWMAAEDVEAIRKRSRSGNSPAWRDHWGEMARKTVVKRLCKYLPTSPEMDTAARVDEATAVGVSQVGGEQVARLEHRPASEAPRPVVEPWSEESCAMFSEALQGYDGKALTSMCDDLGIDAPRYLEERRAAVMAWVQRHHTPGEALDFLDGYGAGGAA